MISPVLRRFLLASLIVLSLAARTFAATPPPQALSPVEGLPAHARVLVLGDSITQDGRYVTFLEYYLNRLAPGAGCDVISIGLSSETVSGLTEKSSNNPRPWALERLDRALHTVKPTVVLACYGMNDGIYHPSDPARLAAFTDGLRIFIAKVRATGARLVLITPPVFDPLPLKGKVVPATAAEFGYGHFFEGYDGVLAEFAAAEVALHIDGVTVIDLHTPMAAALAAHRLQDPAFSFAQDGVHPGDLGHLVMARVIAGGLGLAVPAGPAEAELARIQADPIFPLVAERRALRSEAWLPFVGYTSGAPIKSGSVTAAEKVAARLQAEIDAQAAK
jgi:lysophospholipase L1-like esterase